MESGRSALVAGATGLVGRALLTELARSSDVSRITLPLRRSLPEGLSSGPAPEKLQPVLVDFSRLELHMDVFRVDQIFICLGTTIRDAGSREAFRRVDLEYVAAVARAGVVGGARDLLLVSSLGADPRSRVFYSRVKGEAEQVVSSLPYRSVTVFRPSLLLGEREVRRPGERAGALAAGLLKPLLVGPLARYRPVAATEVARAMAAVAKRPEGGVRVVESEEIARLARAD